MLATTREKNGREQSQREVEVVMRRVESTSSTRGVGVGQCGGGMAARDGPRKEARPCPCAHTACTLSLSHSEWEEHECEYEYEYEHDCMKNDHLILDRSFGFFGFRIQMGALLVVGYHLLGAR